MAHAADNGVNAGETQVFGGNAFVNYGAALEEDHPRCDSIADRGDNIPDKTALKHFRDIPAGKCMTDIRHARTSNEGDDHKNQVQCANEQRQTLLRPISSEDRNRNEPL